MVHALKDARFVFNMKMIIEGLLINKFHLNELHNLYHKAVIRVPTNTLCHWSRYSSMLCQSWLVCRSAGQPTTEMMCVRNPTGRDTQKQTSKDWLFGTIAAQFNADNSPAYLPATRTSASTEPPRGWTCAAPNSHSVAIKTTLRTATNAMLWLCDCTSSIRSQKCEVQTALHQTMSLTGGAVPPRPLYWSRGVGNVVLVENYSAICGDIMRYCGRNSSLAVRLACTWW